MRSHVGRALDAAMEQEGAKGTLRKIMWLLVVIAGGVILITLVISAGAVYGALHIRQISNSLSNIERITESVREKMDDAILGLDHLNVTEIVRNIAPRDDAEAAHLLQRYSDGGLAVLGVFQDALDAGFMRYATPAINTLDDILSHDKMPAILDGLSATFSWIGKRADDGSLDEAGQAGKAVVERAVALVDNPKFEATLDRVSDATRQVLEDDDVREVIRDARAVTNSTRAVLDYARTYVEDGRAAAVRERVLTGMDYATEGERPLVALDSTFRYYEAGSRIVEQLRDVDLTLQAEQLMHRADRFLNQTSPLHDLVLRLMGAAVPVSALQG